MQTMIPATQHLLEKRCIIKRPSVLYNYINEKSTQRFVIERKSALPLQEGTYVNYRFILREPVVQRHAVRVVSTRGPVRRSIANEKK